MLGCTSANNQQAPEYYVEEYPGLAGQPLDGHGSTRHEDGEHLYAPFSSKLEWLFARWAKLRGPSQTSLDEFLAIPEVILQKKLFFFVSLMHKCSFVNTSVSHSRHHASSIK